MMGVNLQRSAIISPCGLFRYRLWRAWGSGTPKTMHFVMLNPSKADANVDDPTIRKCMGFAAQSGFNQIRVVNLFAYRATDPHDLAANGWQQGPDNDYFLLDAARDLAEALPHEPLVFAWGAQVRKRQDIADRAVAMMQAVGARAYVLRLLDDGTPAHPLMLLYTCKLKQFSQK